MLDWPDAFHPGSRAAMSERAYRTGPRLVLVWLLLLAPAFAQQGSIPARELSADELLGVLHAGGNVLYFRHASTDFSRNDDNMKGFDDCANQRNLTDKGRAEARRIGEAVRDLRVPIGAVSASPFCRTMETAKLAFGRVEAMPEARGGPARAESSERYAALRRLLGTPPKPGTNSVVVSHGNPFYALAGPPYLAEGEAAVLKPLGEAGFEVIARITIERWGALQRGARSDANGSGRPIGRRLSARF